MYINRKIFKCTRLNNKKRYVYSLYFISLITISPAAWRGRWWPFIFFHVVLSTSRILGWPRKPRMFQLYFFIFCTAVPGSLWILVTPVVVSGHAFTFTALIRHSSLKYFYCWWWLDPINESSLNTHWRDTTLTTVYAVQTNFPHILCMRAQLNVMLIITYTTHMCMYIALMRLLFYFLNSLPPTSNTTICLDAKPIIIT